MRFGPYKNTQALYYSSVENGGVLRRITYVGSNNHEPEAAIDADPWVGQKDLTVKFTTYGSSDKDGDSLTYKWDLDGDGNIDSTDKTPTFTYTTEGMHKVTLTVEDGNGGRDSKEVYIKVGSPPVLVMDSPAPGTTFQVGEVFNMYGYAEGDPDAKLEWEVRQHHDTHWHPFLVKSDDQNGKNLQPAPEPEDYYAATNSHLEFLFTATNSLGLSTTISRLVMPRKLLIDFDTVPSGLEIKLNDTVITTPGTATTWENQLLKIEIADQDLNGVPYTFKSWSNSGSQNQVFLVPTGQPTGLTMTAYFDQAAPGASPTPAAPSPTPAAPSPTPAGPSPTPAAPSPTVSSSGCKPQVLLLSNEFVQSNSWSMKAGTDVYMYQASNGNVYVRKGSKQSPKALVWQSDISLWNADYFTKLQADGTYSD